MELNGKMRKKWKQTDEERSKTQLEKNPLAWHNKLPDRVLKSWKKCQSWIQGYPHPLNDPLMLFQDPPQGHLGFILGGGYFHPPNWSAVSSLLQHYETDYSFLCPLGPPR